MIKSQGNQAGRKLNYIASKYGMLSILILIIIVAGIINPAFLTGQNIINIFKQISATGLLAIGMTFVIISGGVDLSVGSMIRCADPTGWRSWRHGSGIAVRACTGSF